MKRIVDLECLFDSLLAMSVPFVIKRSYFRLLLQGYIIPEGRECITMSFDEPRFLKVMKYVVLQDIENYYMYFVGLVIPRKSVLEGVEENKDEDRELNLENVKGDL